MCVCVDDTHSSREWRKKKRISKAKFLLWFVTDTPHEQIADVVPHSRQQSWLTHREGKRLDIFCLASNWKRWRPESIHTEIRGYKAQHTKLSQTSHNELSSIWILIHVMHQYTNGIINANYQRVEMMIGSAHWLLAIKRGRGSEYFLASRLFYLARSSQEVTQVKFSAFF